MSIAIPGFQAQLQDLPWILILSTLYNVLYEYAIPKSNPGETARALELLFPLLITIVISALSIGFSHIPFGKDIYPCPAKITPSALCLLLPGYTYLKHSLRLVELKRWSSDTFVQPILITVSLFLGFAFVGDAFARTSSPSNRNSPSSDSNSTSSASNLTFSALNSTSYNTTTASNSTNVYACTSAPAWWKPDQNLLLAIPVY